MSNKQPVVSARCAAFARCLQHGAPESEAAIQELANVWDELDGAHVEGMNSSKISAVRIERPSWSHPLFTFAIERHGGTVNGSTRAEVQTWQVDVSTDTATLIGIAPRQLRSTAARMNARALADELAAAVRGSTANTAIDFAPDGRSFAVRLGQLAQLNSGPKQTTDGRRRRVRVLLAQLLAPHGWTETSPWRWTRTGAATVRDPKP